MTERSAVHDTFVLDRHFRAEPARVFTAFADPSAKARWFGGPGRLTRGRSLPVEGSNRTYSGRATSVEAGRPVVPP